LADRENIPNTALVFLALGQEKLGGIFLFTGNNQALWAKIESGI
jgi:hypothetical protein